MTVDKKIEQHFRDFLEEEYYPGLAEDFARENCDSWAEKLGDFTVLTSPEGERIQGRGQFMKYCRTARSGATSIQFGIKCLYVRDVSDIPERPGPDDVLHIGHVITEFRLKSKESNCTGSMTQTMPHPERCEWQP